MDYMDYQYALEPMGQAAPAGQKSQPLLTVEQANALAHMIGMSPEMQDLQHRMAMAQALNAKEGSKHSTALGGLFGAAAQGLNAIKEARLQKQYADQLKANAPTQEAGVLALLRARGLLPETQETQGYGDVTPAVPLDEK